MDATVENTQRNQRTAAPAAGRQKRNAASLSPFPPIADYAFLSNCHTGAHATARIYEPGTSG